MSILARPPAHAAPGTPARIVAAPPPAPPDPALYRAPTGAAYRLGLVVLAVLSVAGIVGLAWLMATGTRPYARWAYTAATCSLLLSTTSTAPLVAVLSRQTTGYWGVPARRIADLFALGNIVVAALIVILVAQLPPWTPDRMTIWQSWPGAPRLWDTVAAVLLALVGLALVALDGLPDYAVRRTRAGRGAPAFGWRGTPDQWRVLNVSLAILGTLYLLVVVFLHLLVMSDLGLSLVPAWNDAVMPAYHAASGLEGGLALVTVSLWLLRRNPDLEPHIHRETFHALGRLLLAFSLFWFYFTWSEVLTYWYGREPDELALLQYLVWGTYQRLFVPAALLCGLIPLAMMIVNRLRFSIGGVTVAAAAILIGLVADRVRLFLAAWGAAGPVKPHLTPVPPPLGGPGPADLAVLLGMPSLVLLLVLLAARRLPLLSVWEVRALTLLQTTRRFHRTLVPDVAKSS